MSETAAETRSVVIERSLDHPPAKVWRALAEPELLARWMMPNDIVPERGRRFDFRTQPVGGWDGVVNCEILEVDPPTRMVWEWASGGLVTTITFTLTPEGSGSRLKLVQSGFSAEQEMNRRGAEYGMNRMVDQLPAVLKELGE